MEEMYEIGQTLVILRGENKHSSVKNKVPILGMFKEIIDETQGKPAKYSERYSGGSISLEDPLRLCRPILINGIYIPIITRDAFAPYIIKNIRVYASLEKSLRLFDEIGHNYRKTYECLATNFFKKH